MNYIELINQFWSTNRIKNLSRTESYLYFILLNECNMRNWENPFECSNKSIIGNYDIGEDTLIDARNRLKQKGLISFEPGKRKEKSPVYKILYSEKSSIKAGINPGKNPSKTPGKKPNSFKTETETKTDNIPLTPKGDLEKKSIDKKSLNFKARILFETHFKSVFESSYYWSAKDAGSMNQILNKLKFQMHEKNKGAEFSDDDILNALQVFLLGINDKWILENYSTPIINSKFNEIISQIKTNARHKKTIGNSTEQDEREFIEAVLNGAGRAEYERNQSVH